MKDAKHGGALVTIVNPQTELNSRLTDIAGAHADASQSVMRRMVTSSDGSPSIVWHQEGLRAERTLWAVPRLACRGLMWSSDVFCGRINPDTLAALMALLDNF